MRFAFDLRSLRRFETAYEVEPETFQDIVIARLVEEASSSSPAAYTAPTALGTTRESAGAARLRCSHAAGGGERDAPVPLPRAIGGLSRQSGASRRAAAGGAARHGRRSFRGLPPARCTARRDRIDVILDRATFARLEPSRAA